MVGYTARAEDLDLEGLDEPIEDVKEALYPDPKLWEGDVADAREYFAGLGDRVPKEIFEQLDKLEERVNAAK